MLVVDRVVRSYSPPSGILRLVTKSAVDHTVVALDDVSLIAEPGRIRGLVGPNGAGKTTLIRIVAGLLAPDSGEVSVAGHDPSTDRRSAGRALGLVLADDRSLYWRLTGRQNLEFHGVLHGLSRTQASRRAGQLLERVGLSGRDRKVFGYSTGMRAKLAIARALAHDPAVLVLDEPTRSLDPVAAGEVCAMLRDLASEGRTLVLSSHRLEELERTADDVTVLVEGRIRFDGAMHELRTSDTSVATALEAMLRADLEQDWPTPGETRP